MAVIFDFNGTMFKDSYFHDQAWKTISKQLRGTALSDRELNEQIHGKINEKIVEYLVETDKKTNKEISLKKEALYRSLVQETQNSALVDGLVDYLNYLKHQRIPCTIASASIKENIDFFYEYFELNQWFKKTDIFYDDGTYENKIAMFQDAAKHMKTEIEDCIVFEDSISGIKYAKAAGVKNIIRMDDTDQINSANRDIWFTIRDFNDRRLYELTGKR